MSSRTFALALAAAFAAAPLAAQHDVAAGEIINRTLGEGDPQMDDGAHYHDYVLRGRPGEALLVQMRSDDFDTYLHWGRGEGGDWDEVSGNDDHGDGTDSRLVVRLGEGGEYRLRAAGFDEDEVGEYTLSVTAVSGEVRPGALRVGQAVQGRLSEDDYEAENGFEDHYLLRGAPGEQVTVYAESDDFDTYLEFGSWTGGALQVTAEDDDGAQGTNSEMVAEFGADGEYHVVVRSFSGEETGDYTVRVVQGAVQDEWDDEDDDGAWMDEDEGDDDDFDDGDGDEDDGDLDDEDDDDEDDDDEDEDSGFSGAGMAVVPVRAGEWVQGTLDEHDARDADGGYLQQFTYRARAGERLTIAVSSSQLDAYVMVGTGVYDDFEPLAQDDDSGGGLDAELAWTAPRDGEYTIQVSSAAPGETGTFALEVTSRR